MRLFLVYAVIIISLGQCTALDRIDRVLFYCDFDSNICDFRQQANNGYKWLITQKRTYTDRTGPETAHSNGRYVYTEATQGNPGDAITMQTGWMEPRSTNITISFYRHMYGDHVGSLNLYVLVCNGVSSSSRLVWGTSGSSGNVWLRTDVQVVLGESPHRFKLKFEAIRGIGELGDVAIDTLTVKDNPLLEDYCYSGLGIEYGNIPDSALTASSSFGTNFGPEYSRLNSLPLPPNKGGWSAGILDQRQWIQVDLVENYLVIGIAVQARYNSIQWVSSYQVSYRLDVYSVWNYTPVLCGYSANPGKRAVRAHFQDPIKARFIRVHPLKWHSYISLRWEVFGCREYLYFRENRTTNPITHPITHPIEFTTMGTSQSSSHTLDHNDQTPMLQMGNRTQYPNALVTSSHSEKVNKTTTDVSSMDQPENVQEGRGYSLVLVEIICISIGLLLLILSMLIIVCLTRKIKRRKEEDCNTPAQSRRRLLYNAYECIDDLKSRSIINNAYSMYSINSLVEKDAVYQDISEIKRRDEQGGVNTGCVVVSGLGSGGKTVSRSKTWSHNDDFKERTLPRKSSSMGNERRPEMYVRRPLSKKTPPRIEFRRKVPRTPPPPVPSLPHTSHAHTFHVREYCSAPELPRARPHSDMNVQNNGLKLNSHHTVFLPPVQQNCDLSVVRMSNLTDNLAYSDAIYAEPRETLFDHEAKTSLAKSKDSAFDFDSEPEDETIWEDNPIYEDSDSLSDTDYTTSTLDYSESNLVFRIGCFADYDEMGGEFRKSHIYSEIPEIN